MSDQPEGYELLNCPKCGAPFPEAPAGKDVRCAYCGTVLHARPPPTSTVVVINTPAAASERPRPSPSSGPGRLIGGALLAVLAVGYFGWRWVVANRPSFGWMDGEIRPVVADVNGDGVPDLIAAYEFRPHGVQPRNEARVGAFDGKHLSHALWSLGVGSTDNSHLLALAVVGGRISVVEPLGRIELLDARTGEQVGEFLLNKPPRGFICVTASGQFWAEGLLIDPDSGVSHPAPEEPAGCSVAQTSTWLGKDPHRGRGLVADNLKVDDAGHAYGSDFKPRAVPPLDGYHFLKVLERGDAGVGLASPTVRGQGSLLIGFDPATGHERWRAPLGSFSPYDSTRPSWRTEDFADLVDGVFILSAHQGWFLHLLFIDPRTGQKLHDTSLRMRGFVWASAVSGGRLYLAVRGAGASGPSSRGREADPPLAVVDVHQGAVLGWWGSRHP